MFKRVVLKVSGEGLAGDDLSEHFDKSAISRITDEVIQLVKSGVQISIVAGGGNFWRGRDADPAMDKAKAHQIGMLGTIMNGIYLAEAFRLKNMSASVLTPFEVNGFTLKFTKESAESALDEGKVLIFSGGTGHPFFSTDSIAAIRACELRADAILWAKAVDGVYSADPRKDGTAKKYRRLSYATAIANNLSVADISALSLTSSENIPSIVFALSEKNSIIAACSGSALNGTIVSNNIKEEFYE